MRRRDFFKLTGLAGLSSALMPLQSHSSHVYNKATTLDLPYFKETSFPYDSEYFEAAERFVFLDAQHALLNIIPKSGRSIDIRLYRAEDRMHIASSSPLRYSSVKDSLSIPLTGLFWGPEFHYRLEYRDSGSKGLWRAAPERRVKTPAAFIHLGRLEVMLIGDDHTFDDADLGSRVVENRVLRELRLSGDYVNLFLGELARNSSYFPEGGTDLAKMTNGYCLARMIHHIRQSEDPDFVIILGDTTGIGASYKWKGLGLKNPTDGLTDVEYDRYSGLFWLRMRKMLSALTPHIPVYIALGNHDGESGYDRARPWAGKYRKKLFPQPGLRQGGSVEENYFPLIWGRDLAGRGSPLFIILDNESYPKGGRLPKYPDDWSLGQEQKEWFKGILDYESDWKFVFFHHVLGGWPRGSNEDIFGEAYGRGPLFSFQDYQDYITNPDLVEQVELTRLMKENGVSVNFYGHDHVFHIRHISEGSSSKAKKMYGICVGSSKNYGEISWYKGKFWKKHYGHYGRYHTEPSATSSSANFWGPSGYTKLTLSRDGGMVEYKRAAHNHPYTNIPPELGVGLPVHSLKL